VLHVFFLKSTHNFVAIVFLAIIPDWIIILFFVYLDAFIVEKLDESACRVILTASPSLENWGLKHP
jgi:hypothetical protein